MRPMLEAIPSLLALEPLAGSTIRSTALIAIAALAALALRRAPAARRHLVWTLALLGCVSMPLASRVVPGWSLPVPAWDPPDATQQGTAGSGRLHSAGDVVPPPAPSPTPARRNRAPDGAPAPDRTPPASAVAWRLGIAEVARMLPALWLAGAVLLLGRYLLGWLALSRVVRRAAPMTDVSWERALARHGVTLGLRRHPAIRISPEITVPVVCGTLRPTILVPVEALDWPHERRDVVLLHELAHVRRFDLLTARATQLASMLYWFNPFVWLAARCQRTEAERACDDQVLDAGGRASAYASDLLEIARAVGGADRFDVAALAMARRSQLEGRLLAILDPTQRRGRTGGGAIAFSALVAAASISLLAAARPARLSAEAGTPTVAARIDPVLETHATPDPASQETLVPSAPVTPTPPVARAADELVAAGISDWFDRSDTRIGSWNHKSSRGTLLKSKGTVRYGRDLDDVESISPGGFVEIEDRRDGRWHQAMFRPRSGRLERTYSVDGVERPWDTEARAWLAGFLIDIDRGSGAFADQRFPRLMSEGGPARVLSEVSLMTSDYGRSIYYRRLLASDPDELTVRRVVTQAGREISSDYELARTLVDAAKHNALVDAATRAAYLEAVNSLESDYEHGRVLMVLVERQGLSPGLVDGAIASAAKMESDYEQARVMIALAEEGHVKPPQQVSFIQASHDFDSDYERGRVLRALIGDGRLSSENIGAMLLATARFQSDHERANVLVELAESMPLDGAQRAAFVQATKAFSSDHDRGRALTALGMASGR